MTILESEVYKRLGKFEVPGYYYKSASGKSWSATNFAQSLYRIKAADVPDDVEPVLCSDTKNHLNYRGAFVYFSRTQPHKR